MNELELKMLQSMVFLLKQGNIVPLIDIAKNTFFLVEFGFELVERFGDDYVALQFFRCSEEKGF